MTDEDVKAGLLVWDETDLGCGKGQFLCLKQGLANEQHFIKSVLGIGQLAWYVFSSLPHQANSNHIKRASG